MLGDRLAEPGLLRPAKTMRRCCVLTTWQVVVATLASFLSGVRRTEYCTRTPAIATFGPVPQSAALAVSALADRAPLDARRTSRCSPAGPGDAEGAVGTSRVITEPAAVQASSPMVTGATKTVSLPVLTLSPMMRRVLLEAVVVGGDVAGADVGVVADVGVADVAQVRHLAALAHAARLDLDEGARLGALGELGARPDVGERTHGAAVADDALEQVGPDDARAVADDDVAQVAAGADLAGARPRSSPGRSCLRAGGCRDRRRRRSRRRSWPGLRRSRPRASATRRSGRA